MKEFKKHIVFPIIILLLSIPSLFWLPPGKILGHGPIYPWPNASILWELATKHLFAWVSIGGFGNLNTDPSGFLFHAYSSLAALISGSSHAGQVLFLYFGFVGCIGGMFILARTLGFTSIASLIAGVFYLLSPVVMSGMPIEIVNLRVLPYYIATPVLLSIVVRIINYSSARRELALFGIVSILLGSVGYSSLQYFILHLILICTYIVFAIAVAPDQQKRIKIVRRSFVIFIIMFLANFYWLSSILFNLSGAYASRVEPGFSDVNLLRILGIKLIDGFRMLPYPAQARISSWITFYYTPIVTLITFGLVIISGFAFLSPKTRRAAIFPGLLLIITLFLGKGIGEPFSAVGKVIFLSFPYVTRLFRNPIYFATLVVFALALLIGLAIGEIIRIASTKSWRYLIITVVAVATVVVTYGWQFLIGGPISSQSIDGRSQTIEVPLYYIELAQFLRDDYRTFRIASLPAFSRQDVFVAYRWQDLFVGVPSLSMLSGKSVFKSLYPGSNGVIPLFDSAMHPQSDIISQDTWRALLGIANVRYVTLHNDTDWRYLIGKGLRFSREETHEFVEKSPYLSWVGNFGAIELYELNSNSFLPYFYIPQNIIYSDGDIESLPNIVNFEGYEIRSGVYADENEHVLNRVSDIFVKGELESKANEEKSGEEVLGVVASDVESVTFPYVRWQPGDLVHALVLKKEQFDEWRVRKDPEELLDKRLFYASKRISEIEKWGRKMDLDKAFERYKNKMEEALELLKEDTWQDKRILQQNILRTKVFLEAHREKIMTRKFDEGKKEKIQAIFEELKEEIKDLELRSDTAELIYNFEIPKNGNYQLLIKNEEFSRYLGDTQLEVEFLGEKIVVPIENKEWISVGSFRLEKGRQELKSTKPQTTNLLSEGDWLNNLAQSSFVKDKLITSAHLQLAFPEKSTVYFKPIENYQGNTFYKLSFDYFAYEGEAGITLIQDIEIKQRILLFSEKLLKTEMDSPRHVEKVFKSTPGVETAEFYFWGKAERIEDFKIELFNVKIEKVFEPTIFFHTTQYQKPLQMPRITFVRVNPTKYKLKVEGAKEPYTLVFSESFHEGWKAYVKNTPNDYGEVVASYFDGEIEEGTHQNVFLDRNTFETWGKESIPEERHLMVNGYANSWYITPEDAGGREDYEIIIEFWPQRLFNIGLGVSLVTLLSCLGYIGFSFVTDKLKK